MDIETVAAIFRRNMATLVAEAAARRSRPTQRPEQRGR